jgi:hypothetical protein
VPELLEDSAAGESIHISRKREHAIVSFEGGAERWMVLGVGFSRARSARSSPRSTGRRGACLPTRSSSSQAK